MIAESGLLVAFFLGIIIGWYLKDKKPKVYEIKEFNAIRKMG